MVSEIGLDISPEPAHDAPSPFLPGTQIQFAWDSTSLGALKTCPRKYQYEILEGWRGKGENVHLRFGLEYHRALQDFDIHRCSGYSYEEATHTIVAELLQRTWDWKSEDKYKNREFLVRSVIWYLEKFRDDPAETVTLDDGRPAVEHSFRFELDFGPNVIPSVHNTIEAALGGSGHGFTIVNMAQPYLLCGHLDRVVTYQGDLFVMDRKTTTKTLSDYYFAQFEPDNQMTLYSFASRVIFDAPIRGVIIDAVQVMIEGSRFVRSFTYRTPDQLEEWLHDLRYWLALAEHFAIEGHWPMNDKACFGCRFRNVCSRSPGVREQFLKADFVQLPKEERWNPLKAR